MKIQSNMREYEVKFTENFSFLSEIEKINNKLVVIDKNVFNLYKHNLFCKFDENEIFLIDAIENNKNINTVIELCKRMTSIPAKRNATIIAFGGGITQDIVGFASTILYRGINWLFVPTTLLAQADSCIGSKTSLNLDSYKNLLGTFYPPTKIYIDLGFLETLSKVDFNSGIGEIVKFNCMDGQNNFNELKEEIENIIVKDYQTLVKYVKKSLTLKKVYIEKDEEDLGIRNVLNYGHTFGHAIETLSKYEIPHGQAVLIGMIIANDISVARGILSFEKSKEIFDICYKVLNVEIKKEFLEFNKFLDCIKNDKKRQGKKLSGILLNDEYKLERIHDIEDEEVEKSLNSVKGKIR